MYDLVLRRGPELIYGFPIRVNKELVHETDDVTDRATAFLFHAVRIDAGVTLGHVLRLFEKCPGLFENFRLYFAEHLCIEAAKGATPAADGPPDVAADRLEYLELAWVWALNTSTTEYSSVAALRLNGVGPVLDEDAPQHGLAAGERVRWSVSLMPVRELVDLPVVLRPDVSIIEDDHYSSGYGKTVGSGVVKEVTLGQVLHGVLRELCCHGSPQDKAALAARLRTQVAEVEAGTAELVDADDLLDGLEIISAKAFDAMFERNGNVTLRAIHKALAVVDDWAPVGPAMDSRFDGRVVVRPQFRALGGREFRRLLAEWRADDLAGGETLLASVLPMTTAEVQALTDEAAVSGIAATIREVLEMSSRAHHGGREVGEPEHLDRGARSAARRAQLRSLQQMLELARGLRSSSRQKVGKVVRVKKKLRAANCPIPSPRRAPTGLTQRAIEAARRGETVPVSLAEL